MNRILKAAGKKWKKYRWIPRELIQHICANARTLLKIAPSSSLRIIHGQGHHHRRGVIFFQESTSSASTVRTNQSIPQSVRQPNQKKLHSPPFLLGAGVPQYSYGRVTEFLEAVIFL
ncbi:hypothetical protein KIN20_015431 [Parelaphostrongylus tenuis]|uniref:Uncharacterized protein n=1 Tax=Parelaphostrongylus tenuis TaxID=148309 RepID=A0AAD5MG21_PARTN|nr:hypothetical protein KIN20_015431 [Parelaphostrongylus tenuis]